MPTIGTGPPPQSGRELLRLEGISKRFPGVDALSDVDFDLVTGEAHVLFGENGAGKSTLISLVAGAEQPSAGTIYFKGEKLALASVNEARGLGISAVFQEFSLVPQLTVEENIFLGAEVGAGPFLDKRELRKRAVDILGRLGFPLNPQAPLASRR